MTDADVLHGLDRDLRRAREEAARAVDRCEALAELLEMADAAASALNQTYLTAEQLADSLASEQEHAHLIALTDRAYKTPDKENA